MTRHEPVVTPSPCLLLRAASALETLPGGPSEQDLLHPEGRVRRTPESVCAKLFITGGS